MESGALLPRSEPSVSSKPDVRGGWRAALFLIAAGFAERGGFSGVQGNLIMYLTGPLGLSTAAAAAGANAWNGTVLMLPLLGAVAADSCIGRYRAVVAAGVLYLLVGLLALKSSCERRFRARVALHPPPTFRQFRVPVNCSVCRIYLT